MMSTRDEGEVERILIKMGWSTLDRDEIGEPFVQSIVKSYIRQQEQALDDMAHAMGVTVAWVQKQILDHISTEAGEKVLSAFKQVSIDANEAYEIADALQTWYDNVPSFGGNY